MSREAIAAVLARDDLASGERLVALSLASVGGRDNRAWPGAPAAAARAGLRRSRYQEARDQLVRRGLVDVDVRATGRRRASTVSLVFANQGPWWEGEINVELLEAVLRYSQATGPARLLLATLAAIADESGTVQDLATADLCAAAGITDKTYRQARRTLVSSGQIGLVSSGVGGRGNTNVWVVPDPRLREGCGAGASGYADGAAGWCEAPRGHGALRRGGSGGRPAAQLLGRKGRSGSDSFGGKVFGPYRGFRRKGRSGSDTLA
jgi:hypothetical protein